MFRQTPGSPLRLLLVEDSPEQRTFYREVLELHQHEQAFVFDEAELGEDGLAHLRQSPPDCVLLDYRLPDMDGLEFLVAITDGQGKTEVPVIMLTNQGDERVAVEAMKLGASDYLNKGVLDGNRLLFSIRSAIRQRREEQFRSLLESAPDAMVVTDRTGQIMLVNAQTERIFGYSRRELLGASARRLMPERYHNAPHLSSEKPEEIFETGLELYGLRKDGTEFPVEVSIRPVLLGGETLLSSAIRDITERKVAEEALRRSEARNRALLDAIPDAMVHLTKEGTYLDLHLPPQYRTFVNPENLLGASAFEVLPDEIAAEAMGHLTRAIETGQLQQFEYEVDVDGERHMREARIVPIGTDEVISIQRDITQRKRAEEAVRESEQRFRQLFENSPDAIFVEDMEGYVLDANPAACRLHGLARTALIDTHISDLVPAEYRPHVKADFRRLIAQPDEPFESESWTADGRRVPVEIRASRITFRNREALLLHVRDVTERRRAEAEVKRLKAFYEQVLDDLPADVSVLEPDGRIVYLNRASVADDEMRAWLVGKTGLDYCQRRGLDPAIAHRRLHYIEQAIAQRGILSFEESLPRRDGSVRHILRFVSPVLDPETDTINQLLGYGLDITARKDAEDALRRREAMLRTIVTNIPVVLFALDHGGVFTLAEGKGMEAFGTLPGETVGRSAFALFRKEPGIQDDLRRALAGEAFNTVTEVNDRAFECWYAPLTDPKGQVEAVIGVAADITRLVRSQEELARSREELRSLAAHIQEVREEERTRLSREVHDLLGQAMTALRMDVMWVEKSLPEAATDGHARLETMKRQIDETIHTIRRIAHDLRPGVLDDLGVAAAIEWEAQNFERRTGIVCHTDAPIPDLSIERERATALFRIFQELLTNVARHAQATEVNIILIEGDGELVLEVADNGVGIRKEDLQQTKSLGLLGMRERVLPFGGTIAFAGRPGRGTSVTVTLPLTAPSSTSTPETTPQDAL